MSDADREKWNARFAAGSYAGRDRPTALLEQIAPTLRPGRALDVACGAGRNTLFLAGAGWQVDAVDISAAGLERARDAARRAGLTARWIEADLEVAGDAGESPADRLPAGPYDLILQVRYVNAELLPHLAARLAPGGTLLSEQHVDSREEVVGPRNPAYRLRRNALLVSAMSLPRPSLDVVFYREGLVVDPDGRRAALAQLVLRQGGGR